MSPRRRVQLSAEGSRAEREPRRARRRAEIERLRGHHRDVRTVAGKRLIWKKIQTRKAERRELAGALARDGLSPSMIAPAADLTPAAVSVLGRSG